MFAKVLPLISLVVLASACSPDPVAVTGLETPEAAVVAWFDSVDAGQPETASNATYDQSLALILGLENGLDAATIAAYLDDGVPISVQASYWASFSEGFVEFASRPLSTLTVGESAMYSSEGVEFATVPIANGGAAGAVVITRMTAEGTWVVDLVASLGDGFAKLLASNYDVIPIGESGDRIRLAYAQVVVPSLWAALASETFDDDFTRTALAIIESVSRSQ